LQTGRRQEAEEPAEPLPPSPVTPPAAPALEPERTPSPGRGTPPPIDQRVFERLRQTIGSDEQQKLAELVSIFIAHTDKFFHDLEQAAAQDNTESLQYMAHTLKSSSASLGAMRLSRLCRELELACHANDVALAKELASQVSDELHKVHQALEDIRNREG
jgi:HPt (histidine-containing phosphotransfer) domain-containing protein